MSRIERLSGAAETEKQGASPATPPWYFHAMRVTLRGFWPFGGVCGLALARALFAPPPERAPGDIDEATRRAAFSAVESEESNLRRDAAKAFPTDLWSRDDDFHERELRRARDWAGKHRVRLGDVLGALDDGMHAGWPSGNRAPLIPTVPPCRPRAIY
jgi:hypothetical protein